MCVCCVCSINCANVRCVALRSAMYCVSLRYIALPHLSLHYVTSRSLPARSVPSRYPRYLSRVRVQASACELGEHDMRGSAGVGPRAPRAAPDPGASQAIHPPGPPEHAGNPSTLKLLFVVVSCFAPVLTVLECRTMRAGGRPDFVEKYE